MERLGKLFGSPARPKLLRLFLFNQSAALTLENVSIRSSLERDTARRELTELVGVGILIRRGVRAKASYRVNPRFEHLSALERFISDTTVLRPGYIVGALRRVGTLRLVALSGLFTGVLEAQIDLLVVGDNFDVRELSRVVRALEAELGREIRYAAFETADFRYRLSVYDRLLRDVFDYPHRLLIDRIGL